MAKRKAKKSTGAKTSKAGKVAKTSKRKSTTRRRKSSNPFGIDRVRAPIDRVPTLI